MAPWIDYIIIGIAVVASAAYATYSLGPKGLRAVMRKHLLRRTQDAAGGDDIGCGGCSGCASESKSAEVKVPLSNLRVRSKQPL